MRASTIGRRVAALEKNLDHVAGDALKAWQTLLSNEAPTRADVTNLLAAIPGVPAMQKVACELVDAGLTQLSPADAARVRTSAINARARTTKE